MKFLKRDSRSWKQAWDQLAEKYGDIVCENPDNGEVWQYMSTVVASSGLVRHQFRHRALPGKTEYEYFEAHGTFEPGDYQ